jgi:23S rRNA pseudouridine2605 synthase
VVTIDGVALAAPARTRLFRFHKPDRTITAARDPEGRRTIYDVLPKELPRLMPVGRLDWSSEGLLLLTNDGELSRALELPDTALVRQYRARARGRVTQAELDALKDGVTVDGIRYGPIEATIDKAKTQEDGSQSANLWISVSITEGKNREVRKVLESVGLKVNRLIRLAYGPFALSTLPPGEIEEVGPRVIRELFSDLIAPEDLPRGDRPQWSRRAPVSEKRREAAAESVASAGAPEARARPAYKPGWARPKAKAAGPRPPRKGPARKPDAPRPGMTDLGGPGGGKKAHAVRPSGSPTAGGRPPGPRGPKRSASPPGRSGAPRKGPPKGGDRGPRG